MLGYVTYFSIITTFLLFPNCYYILNKHRCTGKMDGHNHFTGSQVGHQASTVILHTYLIKFFNLCLKGFSGVR